MSIIAGFFLMLMAIWIGQVGIDAFDSDQAKGALEMGLALVFYHRGLELAFRHMKR